MSSLNRPVSCKKIEAVIRNLPTKKSTGPDSFNAEFYENFQEELVPILLSVFHKIETGESLFVAIGKGDASLISFSASFLGLLIFFS